MKKTLALLLALLLILSLSATAEQSSQEIMNRGIEAYNSEDYILAFGCFYELAERGDPAAQFNLGLMYERGKGVEQSYEKALEYYLKAAEQGNASAQFSLGSLYQYGEGVEQSFDKAAEYYRLAADQGDADAWHNLGLLYLRGEGVEKSAEQAAECFRLAAEQGVPEAQYNLAVMHQSGEGVEKSDEKALEYYLMAADNGHSGAQYNLAVMYQDGIGVEKDIDKALEYYHMAADLDYASALFNLGVLYERGNGVEQSYEQAAEYYRRAAELGDGKAQYNLGAMYLDGDGVEQSVEQAAEYFRMAAEQGLEPAQEKLAMLEAALAVAGDDPLRAEAIEAGMELPEPADGEKLYLGVGSVPGTQQARIFLAFLLAPNGRSIRWMDLYGQALEVPLEGSDQIHLIDSHTTTPEDHWIALELDVTDITFNSETGKGVFDLRFDGDGASCRVVLAGRFEDAGQDMRGDFRAEAEVALENQSGEAAVEAVDPPTLEQAQAAEMKLPEPEAGEALYLGAANVSQAETLYLAFVLTADGQSLRDLTVLARNMDITYSMGDRQVHVTASNESTTVNGAREIADEMAFGNLRLSDFALDGDAATAVLHYAYHDAQDNVDYPFDPARVAFAKVK